MTAPQTPVLDSLISEAKNFIAEMKLKLHFHMQFIATYEANGVEVDLSAEPTFQELTDAIARAEALINEVEYLNRTVTRLSTAIQTAEGRRYE